MNKQKVKKYFSEKNTVVRWWNDEINTKYPAYKQQEEIVVSIINQYKIKNILDVSAGYGRFARKLSNNRDYVCLDISQQMLGIINKQKLGVKLLLGDAENIPLKNKFDCIICAEALVHYPNPNKALYEMRRLLRKDGILVITVDNKYCLNKIIRILENLFNRIRKKSTKPLGNEIFSPYSHSEYITLFHNAGFKVESKANLSILTTPIKLYSNNQYLLPLNVCYNLGCIDRILERLPIIRQLSSYFIYVLKHEN